MNMTASSRNVLTCLALLGLACGGCNQGGSTGGTGGGKSGGPAVSAAGPAASSAPAAVKTVKTKTGIEMAVIPAGEFLMGDNKGDDDEKPAHRVQISSFQMDVCEVTQQEFQAIMGRNPSKAIGPNRPVERVSWRDAIQYCNGRSTKEGLKPCYNLETMQCDFAADGYRLPTEAEWEYAARAGTATRWSFGNEPADLPKFGWFKGNSDKTTHPVKQKQPNPWGLYDVYGNVAEWCNDYYNDTYESLAQKDPRGPSAGTERVMRGGSFTAGEDTCRSSARQSQTPVFADTCFGSETFGFRCVRKADNSPNAGGSKE